VRTRLAVLSLAAVVAAVAAPATARAEGSDNGTMCVFNTQLRGANELPAPTTSAAMGHTQIKVRNNGEIEYTYVILNKANEPFFAGHIHKEAPGEEVGPPVVLIFSSTPATTARHIGAQGGTEPMPALAQDICENPSEYYINFHTNPGFPAGAIRGDLG